MAIFVLFLSSPIAAQDFPLTATQNQQRALAAACEGRDGWGDAAPPARVFGNSYYVGTCGITVLLVTSPDGHVLIDGAVAEAAPSILANIRSLGFKPEDVKLIVGTHEHVDHMGGIALLKAATGARLMVREPARKVLETGHVDARDPQFGIIAGMTPVAVDATYDHGEVLRVGDIALTAVATPGHTDGGTSWHWRSCEATRCMTIAYLDSLSAVSAYDYRFTDHPERVAPFAETFARVRAMPGDLFLTAHPSFSNMFERFAAKAPLIDRDAGRRLVHAMRKRLDGRLAKEAAGDE
ncbi:MAG: subclass B3 metallo-beta-lactamase [Sphingopyxis sp.]|nr:subclass B3 metallo-beta-lactamase [Sphingopyxis sp.]